MCYVWGNIFHALKSKKVNTLSVHKQNLPSSLNCMNFDIYLALKAHFLKYALRHIYYLSMYCIQL